MAKSHSSKSTSANNLSIANSQLLRQLTYPTPKPATPITDFTRSMALAQLDRRSWKPDITVRAPGAIQRKHARLYDRGKITFAVPNKIAICVRRKRRKEILFAKKLTRKGSSRGKEHRQNFWSSIKC